MAIGREDFRPWKFSAFQTRTTRHSSPATPKIAAMNLYASQFVRWFHAWTFAGALSMPAFAGAASVTEVVEVESQPLIAQVRRLIEAAEISGEPFTKTTRQSLEEAMSETDSRRASAAIQKILDPLCMFFVQINPESRVKAARGSVGARLVEHGWRQFLVKVVNEAGVTAALRVQSPNAKRLHGSPADDVPDRWLDLATFDSQPMQPALSGLKVEYRIVQLYSRDAGRREGKFTFDVGQGTQDLGFRSEVAVLFECRPAQLVTLRVRDENGEPATACFVIRDKQGRVHPSQAKRLAPDFSFHPQIYRADGETIRLPDGDYRVEFSRGPESLVQKQVFTIQGKSQTLSFAVKRWIDPTRFGYWSGDHHIHAAGCAHYTKPSEGVHPPDMMRHCLGEDLKVGCNLTWGPCFDYQKQFFCGDLDKVSQYPYLLRYDVEVSGFGSHQSGHLCLLRLKEQIYPGGDSMHHWPTLGLNTLRWSRKQGAIGGPAHSGWGLKVATDELPNYVVPPFDGIGANEYIVDVTHEIAGPDGRPVPAVDFMSTVDTPYVWELNIWYHTLNAGFRTRISGETDFPCIFGERVGLGRSYVKLDGKLDFDEWCEGIRLGRNYVSEGRSHLFEFKVNNTALGENGSELRLDVPGSVRVTAKVAALLDLALDERLKDRPYDQKPYWHIERARIADTREVPVEVLVNGFPVAHKNLVADSQLRDVAFDVNIERSSWIALRILPSSHTNPIWVSVGGQPYAVSRRSVEWCLKGVDQCWSQKERFIKADEIQDATQAYEHARRTYRKLLAGAVAP